MPGGAGFGAGLGGFRADGVVGVGVAVALPVGGYQAGSLFPVQPGDRVVGDRAEGLMGPGRLGRGGVFAEPAGAVVHGIGEFAQVAVQISGASTGNTVGPASQVRAGWMPWSMWRMRESRTRATSRAPAMLRLATAWLEDLGAVEPGGFGFAEGPPEPGAGWVVQGLLCEVGGQRVAEGLLVFGGLGAAGYVVPDAAENAEVVGVGQFAVQGLGRGEFAAVAGRGLRRGRRPGGRTGSCSSAAGWSVGRAACSRSRRLVRSSSGAGRLPGRVSAARGWLVMQ